MKDSNPSELQAKLLANGVGIVKIIVLLVVEHLMGLLPSKTES